MFVSKVPITYTTSLVEIIAWHGLGDNPLSEPILVRFRRICDEFGPWPQVNVAYCFAAITSAERQRLCFHLCWLVCLFVSDGFS